MISTCEGIPDHVVKLLAALILRRTRLTGVPNTTREDALAIIQGVTPAPAKDISLAALGITPATGEAREIAPDHRRLFARAVKSVTY